MACTPTATAAVLLLALSSLGVGIAQSNVKTGHEKLPVVHFWPPNPYSRHRKLLESAPKVDPRVLLESDGERGGCYRDAFSVSRSAQHCGTRILYGGVAMSLQPSSPHVEEIEKVVSEALLLAGMKGSTFNVDNITSFERHPLLITNDHGESTVRLKVLFVGPTGSRQATEAVDAVNHGVNYFFRVMLPSADLSRVREHSFSVSLDKEGYYNLYQHTHVVEDVVREGLENVEVAVSPGGDVEDHKHGASSRLRVLSLNVWNTNPPSWVYNDREKRQSRYDARMDLLADVITASGAEVIALQEVRYDSTISAPGSRFQLAHILDRLGSGWQFAYQPVMDYFDVNRKGREEEGLAILSRHPIRKVDYVLLPRLYGDSDDSQHQRACLHALVDVTRLGTTVDVFATHLSLSKDARERSVVEIWHFLDTNSSSAGLHLLMGDLNAEPDTEAIQFLQGLRELRGAPQNDLKDAWLEVHNEPEPRSTDAEVKYNALSFPSDDPKKRIDIMLYRNGPEVSKRASVSQASLVGQNALESTQGDPGHGMLDADSPMWASDHRGLLVEFEFK